MIEVAVARHLPVVVVGLSFDERDVAGNIFVGHMPSKPDRAVMVSVTGGMEQPTRAPTDLPTVQLIVRSAKHDYASGRRRADLIYDALACLDNEVLDPGGDSEVLVHGTTPMQTGPVHMGEDENGRHEWSLNFRFRVHHPTRHRPAHPVVT